MGERGNRESVLPPRVEAFLTRWKLWAIRRLLWRADAIICSLPTPDAPEGDYFVAWGDLGHVHGSIGRAYNNPSGVAHGSRPR